MTGAIQWTEAEATVEGVAERAFTVDQDGEAVSCVFWRPESSSGPAPLVLMGHGGGGHKRNERMVHLGRMFAGVYGWNAVSMDGLAHGDRGPVTDATDPAYREMWGRENPVQDMIDDWVAVLDAAMAYDLVDPARIGYWGVSMGTMFGLPFVASEPRVKAAVLGKAGFTGSSVDRSGVAPYFERYAPQISQPLLFSIQWDDERFERDGQLDLYDRLGSADKRLHAYPGLHVDNGLESFVFHAEFLKRYL
jgi:dienelactone hydrolase